MKFHCKKRIRERAVQGVCHVATERGDSGGIVIDRDVLPKRTEEQASQRVASCGGPIATVGDLRNLGRRNRCHGHEEERGAPFENKRGLLLEKMSARTRDPGRNQNLVVLVTRAAENGIGPGVGSPPTDLSQDLDTKQNAE